MKDKNRYISPNGNDEKINLDPLIDWLLMFIVSTGLITALICILCL